MKNQKEIINALIERLKQIRDTEEIENVEVIPYEEIASFEMIDGKKYVRLQTSINIEHKSLYQKGNTSDDFIYKSLD